MIAKFKFAMIIWFISFLICLANLWPFCWKKSYFDKWRRTFL